ncbi:hypothetical protein ACPCBX_13635 [Streptomyces tuirus]|uniref:Uncharacterized protein n=1 Tax=Streptomyces tuirus TaxID=68278 RepID=A0A7G1NBY2_9ACTN|nr:hypothetical protein [Streptomyces tuirus]BCL20299.1 hypothetical protein GCM10017668_21420 [Streptomyces tuirus]
MSDQPPAEVMEFARNYKCGHCSGDTMELVRGDGNLWHGYFRHDDGCPVQVGAVSSIPDSFRALPPGYEGAP